MNNFILSFIFLICLILYYLLVGSFFLTKMKIEKNRFAVYVVVGWIITFVLGWLTGFPAQLNAKSWYYFANHFQIALIIMGLIAAIGHIFFHKKQIKETFEKINEKPIIILYFFLDHLKRYWFIYLFVGVFTWFSITNLQPYTLNNYTDDHYITKMVHSMKSNVLFQESQYNGQVLKSYGKYSLALQQQQRMFNTYEIVYTYFANLFGIGMVTFARFAMTIHNYLMWFLVFQLLGSIFVDSDKSQYTIASLALLLIPEGYSARGAKLFVIRIFEIWRNQTAMYMGGTIVRNTAFPLMLYFAHSFYKKKSVRGFLIFPILALMLLSYQTTAISYVLLFIPLFVFGFILDLLWKHIILKKEEFNKSVIWISASAVVIAVLFILIANIDTLTKTINITANQNFATHTAFNAKSLTKLYKGYLPYYNNVFKLDFFAKTALIPIALVLILAKDKKDKIIAFLIGIIYLIFKLNKMKLTLSLISLEFYCTPRMLHGMELLIFALYGIAIILIIQLLPYRIKKLEIKNIIIPLTSTCIVLGTVGFMNKNMSTILKYHKEADGVISSGYSTLPLRENDQMMPNMFIEIGEYFNSLPNKKYGIYAPSRFKYKGITYTNQYLLFSSKNLYIFEPDWTTYYYDKGKGDRAKEKEILKINIAWVNMKKVTDDLNVNDFTSFKQCLDDVNLNYAFFTNQKIVNLFLKYGWKIVFGGKSKGYWIIKRQN